MVTPVGNGFSVEIRQLPDAGTPWVVRLYRKSFLRKKRISSDWFLDEKQARGFASQLSESLKATGNSATAESRKPGWTLLRPNR